MSNRKWRVVIEGAKVGRRTVFIDGPADVLILVAQLRTALRDLTSEPGCHGFAVALHSLEVCDHDD